MMLGAFKSSPSPRLSSLTGLLTQTCLHPRDCWCLCDGLDAPPLPPATYHPLSFLCLVHRLNLTLLNSRSLVQLLMAAGSTDYRIFTVYAWKDARPKVFEIITSWHSALAWFPPPLSICSIISAPLTDWCHRPLLLSLLVSLLIWPRPPLKHRGCLLQEKVRQMPGMHGNISGISERRAEVRPPSGCGKEEAIRQQGQGCNLRLHSRRIR